MDATIALAGNPNAGKTTLFNELTGARQHVGNYPGVTVEKKQGTFKAEGKKLIVVDLPGVYSLTAYSMEELVARDFLANETPALVLNIVDASNIERNLYLTVQFMEMGLPVCIALNMMDVAKSRGIELNVKMLSKLLGVSVVPIIARTGEGKKKLLETVASEVEEIKAKPLVLSYGEDLDNAITMIQTILEENNLLPSSYHPRWIAIKCLEKDDQIIELCSNANLSVYKEIEKVVSRVGTHLKKTLDTYPEAVIADHRYGYISAVMKQGVLKQKYDFGRLQLSDKIDRVLTNRFLGPLIMVAILFALYQFTFTYSALPVGWLESFFGWLGGIAEATLPDGLLKSMVVSGIIDGIGGVLGFAPLIMFMFLGISVLEDSGYLARVAFMLDRVFRIFGLHGSSVMAFIISGGIAGGCAVPGIMASRTLRSPKERLATLLTVPFMNCGAKLPVFALLVGAFFSKNQATMMLIITIISWMGALIVAKILRMTIIRGESTPFVMELPPYRLPTFKGLMIHTWERTWQYIKKAGTVILGISILLWAMMTFPGLSEKDAAVFEKEREVVMATAPVDVAEEVRAADEEAEFSDAAKALKRRLFKVDAKESETALKNSIAGQMGIALESITSFAGFDWRTNIALVGGLAAKEVVVSTLGTAYSMGEVDPEETESLSEALANNPSWSPLSAFSLIIFTIFYAPCFVAVVCIAKEAGSWKWGAFSIIFNTILAFTLSVIIYQAGLILGY